MRTCPIHVGLLQVYPSAYEHVLLRLQTLSDTRIFNIADGGSVIYYQHGLPLKIM